MGDVGNEDQGSVLHSIMDVPGESPRGCAENSDTDEDRDSDTGFGTSELGTKE